MKKLIKNKLMWSMMVVMTMMYACSDSFLDVKPTGSLSEDLLAGSLGLERSIIAAYSQVNGRGNRNSPMPH